jgi:acyl-CoA synthetase (AMP-forming)/AMP-acid ligase II
MTSDRPQRVNIADHLSRLAGAQPHRRAVVSPCGRDKAGRVAYSHLTFSQLENETNRLAHGLTEIGIRRGTRTILMVRPSLDFFILVFALFKIGAVPVVVDPGMGVRRMVMCLKSTRPVAFIGIPAAHLVRTVFRRHFHSVKTWVTVGPRLFWGGSTLSQLRNAPRDRFPTAHTLRDDTAAILFTTGSTGPAKGAIYSHGNFDAQLAQIRDHLDFGPDEIDLSTFPLFALFYPALGITAVIPDMDPTRPAEVNPERILEAITNQGITNMFASPALLNRVGRYGETHRIKLPSLRRVISAGAPVSADIIERFCGMLCRGAVIHTPYGATEAVPIISITSEEILSETRHLTDKGFGICIGRPINEIPIKIISITDRSIDTWNDRLAVPDGEIGELCVQGGLVSRGYYDNAEADRLSKIKDGDRFWHRMGDLGWRDRKGRIWFCGRKSHRVVTAKTTLYTIPCEGIFNQHSAVSRSALVGVGPRNARTPVMVIERAETEKRLSRAELTAELLAIADQYEITRRIRTILYHRSFPVDIRHNSKIFREKLSDWAERRVGSDSREEASQ